MKDLNTFDGLIAEVQQRHLYVKLVRQLNKDLLFANITLEFKEDVLPSNLKRILHETIYKLIQEKFTTYLNLLYVIDVSEEIIKKLDSSDVVKLSEYVTFLMLKREWQKVYYRSHMKF